MVSPLEPFHLRMSHAEGIAGQALSSSGAARRAPWTICSPAVTDFLENLIWLIFQMCFICLVNAASLCSACFCNLIQSIGFQVVVPF